MWALLVHKGLEKALKVKDTLPITTPSDKEKYEIMEKAHNALLLCLGNEDLRGVSEKDTIAKLWLKMESLFISKSLTNWLYLKKKNYTFQILGR